jgi:transposase-like protein
MSDSSSEEELMERKSARRFSRDFKLSAVARMEVGVNVSALSRELDVRRKLLYEWRDACRAGGAEALRPPGRPRKGSTVVGGGRAQGLRPGSETAVPAVRPDALSLARRRIAELERKVGQQALEADFFRQALRLLESCRGASDRSGGSASSASSGPGRGGKAD